MFALLTSVEFISNSPRVFKRLIKLVKAVARLKLKNVDDEEDAK